MTVAELESKLSFKEYLEWTDYFRQTNPEPKGAPNMLDSPENMLSGFGL